MGIIHRRFLVGSFLILSFIVSLVMFLVYQPTLKKTILYFPSAGSMQIESEIHSIPYGEGLQSQIRSSIESLKKGPLSKEFRRTIPEKTLLRSVFLKGKRVWIDFDSSIQALDPECPLSALNRFDLIKKTIQLNFRELSDVQILVAGQIPGYIPYEAQRKS